MPGKAPIPTPRGFPSQAAVSIPKAAGHFYINRRCDSTVAASCPSTMDSLGRSTDLDCFQSMTEPSCEGANEQASEGNGNTYLLS